MNRTLIKTLRVINFFLMGSVIVYMLLFFIGFLATGYGEYLAFFSIEILFGVILSLSILGNRALKKIGSASSAG